MQNTKFVNESNFTGYMFVSFDTIKEKESFLSQCPHKFFDKIYYYLKNIKYYLFCCCVSKDVMDRFKNERELMFMTHLNQKM